MIPEPNEPWDDWEADPAYQREQAAIDREEAGSEVEPDLEPR